MALPRLDRGSFIELGFVLGGVVLFAVLFTRTYEEIAVPLALTLDAELEGVDETWSGIYVGDEKIGYGLSRSAPLPDGGFVLQDRSQLELTLMGATNTLTLSGDVRINPQGKVDALSAHVRTDVQGRPVTLRAEGRPSPSGKGMKLDVFQAGRKVTTLDLDDVPATPGTIYRTIADRNPDVGDRVSLPYFNPLSLGRAEAIVTVQGREPATLPDGTEVSALRLRVDHSGQVLDVLIAPDGTRISEREAEGGLGMRVQLETREAALNDGWPADGEPGVDLIALSSISLDQKLPGGGRSLTRLVLEVQGPASVDELLTRYHGERWDPATRQLTLLADVGVGAFSGVPDGTHIGADYPLPSQDRALRPWTRSTTFAPSDDPRIGRTAGDVVGDELFASDASRKLNSWVFSSLSKVPVAGVPQALEVLESRRGDCNEHTTLYTALARSLGLPTRMAAGIVYSEAIFADGAFYYHAWPEVWLGDRWVAIDPTFGQFPADATHLKLVEGELDKQMELMGVIGRLSLSVIDSGDAVDGDPKDPRVRGAASADGSPPTATAPTASSPASPQATP